MIEQYMRVPIRQVSANYYEQEKISSVQNQDQTSDAFTEKWGQTSHEESVEKINTHQQKWFYELYGFENEEALKEFLSTKRVILDAGSGLGYKASWMAQLAPEALVIAMDISDAGMASSEYYSSLKNLVFVKGDIAATGLEPGSVDFVLCDQVIMHTEKPDDTFKHLSNLLSPNGVFATYVYAKKALPRELLDDYFREKTHELTNEELWEFSRQLTELGKRLSELNIEMDFPDISLLGIKGGKQDLQRFIYWNFIKCFWNEELGRKLSDNANFDWYSPSNAKRFTREEFLAMVEENNLKTDYLHSEEACYSGRFSK